MNICDFHGSHGYKGCKCIFMLCQHNYITSLCSALLLVSLFLQYASPQTSTQGKLIRKTQSSFCICFPFITATESWGVGSSLLRKTQRLAYLPQSGYEREPSALPSWGLALRTDEKPSVRSQIPIGRLEANRSLRMKSGGLEIKPAHFPFGSLPPCVNILQI